MTTLQEYVSSIMFDKNRTLEDSLRKAQSNFRDVMSPNNDPRVVEVRDIIGSIDDYGNQVFGGVEKSDHLAWGEYIGRPVYAYELEEVIDCVERVAALEAIVSSLREEVERWENDLESWAEYGKSLGHHGDAPVEPFRDKLTALERDMKAFASENTEAKAMSRLCEKREALRNEFSALVSEAAAFGIPVGHQYDVSLGPYAWAELDAASDYATLRRKCSAIQLAFSEVRARIAEKRALGTAWGSVWAKEKERLPPTGVSFS